jgi:hypothetical protein
MKNVQQITMKNGKSAAQGQCEVCNTKVTVIGATV